MLHVDPNYTYVTQGVRTHPDMLLKLVHSSKILHDAQTDYSHQPILHNTQILQASAARREMTR